MTKNKSPRPQILQNTADLVTEETVAALVALVGDAGKLILEVYHQDTDFDVEIKSDSSPITQADRKAHRCIVDGLSQLTPQIPILSEESKLPTYKERSSWKTYWLIDPLDGTKEFLNRNDEFTVNIALITGGVAILGCVHVPVTGVTYVGSQALGAFKYGGHTGHKEEKQREKIAVRSIASRVTHDLPIEIVASRRHGFDKVEKLIERLRLAYPHIAIKNIGSSLKLCLIAEGKADLYPRFGPTSEWDTAAAQAVVEAAGGIVVDSSFSALRYNDKDDILNPEFFVIGDAAHDWKNVLAV